MRRARLAGLAIFLAFAGTATSSRAQYMYLDANGDGIHTAADRLAPVGTPTTVDVWIKTDMNRDGSSGVCPSGDGALTISSYVVNLAAVGGNVTFTGFVNRRPEMGNAIRPFNSSAIAMTAGQGGSISNPPGTYRLMTVLITGSSGSPNVAIVRNSDLQSVDATSFGSQCSGNDFDNTLKVGSDWFDADGLGPNVSSGAPPIITAPTSASGAESQTVVVTATASDPDGNPLILSQTNDAPFFPSSTSVGPVIDPSLSLSGRPGFADAGSYSITWRAVQSAAPSLSATATTLVSIADGPHQDPIIAAPSTVSGREFIGVALTGSATDPDGTNVVLSQTNDASFLSGPASTAPESGPSITLVGTPGSNQAGSYTVAWTAADASTPPATAAASTVLVVEAHRDPTVDVPATIVGVIGVPLAIGASATSPDGAFVTLCATDVPPFLTGPSCVGPALAPLLTLSGTPGDSSPGDYPIHWLATDTTGGTMAATTLLSIAATNRAPVLEQPLDMAVAEGSTASQQLIASDPDGNALTFARTADDPLFMMITSAGLLTLAPGYADAGNYTANVTVSDGALSDAKSFGINVSNTNRCPIADPGGPYTGFIGTPLTLDGSRSSDPDGDPLVYQWDFGDHTTGVGATPTHTYRAGGYLITLTVGDGNCQSTTTTTAAVLSTFPAFAFTTGGNGSVNLTTGKPYWYVQVEPVGESFDIHAVDLSGLALRFDGTSVPGAAVKPLTDTDRNGNGIGEIRLAFDKGWLRYLFRNLPPGVSVVSVEVLGSLLTGGSFAAPPIYLVVKAGSGGLAATVSPNPMNPSARLTLRTTKPGALAVRLFDTQGRLLRTILDDDAAEAGYHEIEIDGKTAGGARLPSGVYFVRIRAEHDGEETKRLTVLK